MLIRKFKSADAAAVSDVIRQTMRVTNSQDYSMQILAPLVEYFSPENVLLLSKERICLVAEIENRVVGTVALEDSELCAFFVHPDFQRKGVGTNLIKAIEDIAAKNKVEIIKFASSLSAVSFYEKIGYRKNGSDREETAGKQIGMEKHLSQ